MNAASYYVWNDVKFKSLLLQQLQQQSSNHNKKYNMTLHERNATINNNIKGKKKYLQYM